MRLGFGVPPRLALGLDPVETAPRMRGGLPLIRVNSRHSRATLFCKFLNIGAIRGSASGLVGAIHLNAESFRGFGVGGSHQDASPSQPYLAKDCAIVVTPQKSKK
jgi:hypothetical protein